MFYMITHCWKEKKCTPAGFITSSKCNVDLNFSAQPVSFASCKINKYTKEYRKINAYCLTFTVFMYFSEDMYICSAHSFSCRYPQTGDGWKY